MKHSSLSMAILALLSTASFADDAEHDSALLDPIIVSADLRNLTVYDMAASVSVLDEQQLQDRGATHFSDVLLELPNLNFSGQSSRPRHLQIRGIGELADYTGRPDPSVGFAIDDIDFSGIGMTGSLFDVEQVEVLRGPQGTRYGANALAGLVNIKTNDPTPYRESMIELTGGDDQLGELGLMTSGAFNEGSENSPLYRFSLFKHKSDGFRDNDYLDKSDTNNRDELNLRGKLHFNPVQDLQVDLTILYADLDNGYDAWSLDNSFTTLSDQPGKDTQRSTAGAVKLTWDGNSNFSLISTTTLADSEMEYGYDGDWAYPGYHSTGDNTYVYNNDKNRDTISQEFRLVSQPDARIFNNSTDWLFGLYGSKLDEDNHTTDNFGTDLTSDYSDTRLAAFGQLDYHFNPSQVLSGGLRIENQDSDYDDNNGENFDPSDTLWGGHLTFTQALSAQHNAYAGVSRGYKFGGFNTGLSAGASDDLLRYEEETALNYEVGLKSSMANNTFNSTVSLFYMDRDNPQFQGYTYVGTQYVYFTENFDSATNYGLEAEFDWQAIRQWNIFGSLGLLKTDVKGSPKSASFGVEDREQAHAPSYQYTIGTQYRHNNGFFGRIALTGVDEFYFDNTHDQKSDSYTITNARIGYEAQEWEVYLWASNLFDEEYATRGFYFANEPTYSIEEQYVRLGDPRQVGVTARMRF